MIISAQGTWFWWIARHSSSFGRKNRSNFWHKSVTCSLFLYLSACMHLIAQNLPLLCPSQCTYSEEDGTRSLINESTIGEEVHYHSKEKNLTSFIYCNLEQQKRVPQSFRILLKISASCHHSNCSRLKLTFSNFLPAAVYFFAAAPKKYWVYVWYSLVCKIAWERIQL